MLVAAQEASSGMCVAQAWIVDDVHLSFRNPSRANFTLIDLNKADMPAETVSCALEFATLCEIRGTPGNKDVYIHLQTKGEDVWVNVTAPYTCEGK